MDFSDLAATDVASLSISGLLITIIGLVIRSIIKGDLLPKSTVDSLLADKDQRIEAQASALATATSLISELSNANNQQADSIRDFSEATHLQVRVAEALHQNLAEGTG